MTEGVIWLYIYGRAAVEFSRQHMEPFAVVLPVNDVAECLTWNERIVQNPTTHERYSIRGTSSSIPRYREEMR